MLSFLYNKNYYNIDYNFNYLRNNEGISFVFKKKRFYILRCEICKKIYIGGSQRFCSNSCSVKCVAWNRGLTKKNSCKLRKIYNKNFSKAVSIATTRKIKFKKEKNGCIRCISHKLAKNGYIITKNKKYLHRLLYKKKYGKIKNNTVIRHICNNRWCCNINHLMSGTQKDNINDAVISNRIAYGERHGSVKLSNKLVMSIFSMRLSGLSQAKIGKIFNISQSHVGNIWRKKLWRRLLCDVI